MLKESSFCISSPVGCLKQKASHSTRELNEVCEIYIPKAPGVLTLESPCWSPFSDSLHLTLAGLLHIHSSGVFLAGVFSGQCSVFHSSVHHSSVIVIV